MIPDFCIAMNVLKYQLQYNENNVVVMSNP